MKETITVTQEDINAANEMRGEGQLSDSFRFCPIARACRRRHSNWEVGLKYIRRDRDETIIKMPRVAIKFIDDFDLRREPVKPFSFTIEVPND